MFNSDLFQIIWMRIFLQFVFKWLQFFRTGRTFRRFVAARTLPVGGGVPKNFWSEHIATKFSTVLVLKYWDDIAKQEWEEVLRYVSIPMKACFHLGSVEDMRQPGHDLQSRLENPDPSSVPSKHLLWHWHLGFAKTILTWDIIIIIIIIIIESKFRFVQKPAFSSTLMVFAKTIFLTWDIGNQQVRPPEVCVETDCT